MKRITFILMATLLIAMPSSAQNYKNSRYYNRNTGHLDYGRRSNDYQDTYFGFRIGPSFSYVNSDGSTLDGGNWQTGLNVGVVAGVALSDYQPFYLEGGLYYIEKGGSKKLETGKSMTYDLNYLEIPVVFKYKYNVDPHFSIQPQVGGYFAAGVGGKIKNYQDRQAENSFSENYFRRLDGGLRIGCGVAYDLFYADLTYDIGLANIGHDVFDKTRNGGLQINVGVNF